MPAATRCFLALTVVLACGVSALAATGGSGPAGAAQGDAATTVLAAVPLDTSWGDDYVAPLH
ncbi:hypothetical protein ABZY31_30470 [Streptomyces sp. NPDC006529]|uniref:hypothetical protein n=1 Tax=Streptomyces sp. NPDC006529 TaxID=3157177 RepID=UPI0033B6EED8